MAKSGSSSWKTILLVLGGLGGVGLLLCCGFTAWMWQTIAQLPPREPVAENPCQTAFNHANYAISSRSNGVGQGNTEAARDLAEVYANTMKSLQKEFFTRSGGKAIVSLPSDNFMTYCELNDDACVLLVHVPDLRKYEKLAKDSMLKLAWQTAQVTIADQLESPPPNLVVGVRGAVFYEGVLIGPVKSGEEIPEPEESYRGNSSREQLTNYFCPNPKVVNPENELEDRMRDPNLAPASPVNSAPIENAPEAAPSQPEKE